MSDTSVPKGGQHHGWWYWLCDSFWIRPSHSGFRSLCPVLKGSGNRDLWPCTVECITLLEREKNILLSIKGKLGKRGKEEIHTKIRVTEESVLVPAAETQQLGWVACFLLALGWTSEIRCQYCWFWEVSGLQTDVLLCHLSRHNHIYI